MNKKLISLVIAGVIAVTSLPAVSASAADTSKTQVSFASYSPWQRVGVAKALRYATIYTGPSTSSDEFSYLNKGDEEVVYYAGVSGWYAVKAPVPNGSGWGYIKANKVELVHP